MVNNSNLLLRTTVYPIGFHWDITQACNFRCNFCLTNSGKRAANELSFSQKIELIDRLFKLGVVYIRILGGEPFLLADTIDVMEYAVSRGMQLSFSTNGSLLTDEIVSRLVKIKRGIRYIQVSLYGSSPITMSRVTNSSHPFPKVKHGMQLLRNYGLPFTVLVVMCRENMDDIIPLYRFAKAMSAQNFKIVPKSETGRGRDDTSFHSVQTKSDWGHFVKILQRLKCLEQKSNPHVIFQARPLFGKYIQKKIGVGYYFSLCEGGVHYLYGSPTGELAPCPFLKTIDRRYIKNSIEEFPFHVLRDNLFDVWNSPQFNNFRRLFILRDNLESFYEKCPYIKTGECRPCILTGCQCLNYIKCVRMGLQNSLNPI